MGAAFAPLRGTAACLIFASARAARHLAGLPVEPPLGMRTKGSARFAPYYKVQWYDAGSAAWIDIQKAHATPAAAQAACPTGKTCRVVEIAERSRRPLPT